MRRSTLADWLTLPFALPLAYLNPISRTAIKVIQAAWANDDGESLGRSTPKRLTENELSDFSRLWHDGCVKAIIEAQDVDRNHPAQI